MLDSPKSRIVAFVVLTALFSSIFNWLLIRDGLQHPNTMLYAFGLMWSPGAAAFVVTFLARGSLRDLGLGAGPSRYLWLAYILPILYAAPVYLFVWLVGFGQFSPDGWTAGATAFGLTLSPALGLLVLMSLGFARSFLFALGEEIGWRGLLVPELLKITSFRNTVLISGVFWTLYHVPVMFAGYHGGTTPIGYSFICFTAMVFGQCVIFTWLTVRSASVWPAAVLHASHNLFVQRVFDGSTVNLELTRYFTGEFGIGLVLTTAVAAGILLSLRKKDQLADKALSRGSLPVT